MLINQNTGISNQVLTTGVKTEKKQEEVVKDQVDLGSTPENTDFLMKPPTDLAVSKPRNDVAVGLTALVGSGLLICAGYGGGLVAGAIIGTMLAGPMVGLELAVLGCIALGKTSSFLAKHFAKAVISK